ncbi:general transcriptional corepressor trfA-like [Cynara cardunculus var. scolymus]|uniref:Uncharacterized protein n=1 Tax=Cynara cardunculus var. scolymus TaxID=59895 RepID=A0A103YI60_CYNCS|nr:general transcriptional corepressor trfA-like [Cynara cardunculus var. scolymus]KVI09569.1 hypothetical protein Ccrd_012044 [Cynara cardunculus var. scolymus]
MGCFSICFSTSKHRKLKKSVTPTTSSPSLNQGNENKCESILFTVPTQESTNLGSLKTPISESRDNSEDQLINESCDKTVTIDIDVDTNADISVEEVEILSVESKEGKEKNVNESGRLGFLVQLENEKERDKEEVGKLGVLVQIENEKERKNEEHKDLGVHVEIENEERKKEPKEEDEDFGVHAETEDEKKIERELKGENQSSGVENRAFSDSSVSSYISYPPMHRYHNCEIDEDEDHVIVQEDSSESLFSLAIDPRRQSKSSPVEVDDKEVNSPLKTSCSPKLNTKSIRPCPNRSDLNPNIDSLLNPIENLSQWKTLKAEPTPTLDHHQEKENMYLELEETNIPLSKEPSFKVSDQKGKVKGDNSAVNTSLSSWLIGPDKTPTISKGDSQFSTGNSFSYSDEATSWKSFEDRPILGAWTIDEVRQVSARSSPRKSPCRNPDEMPIIGTVGSYWSHTGQAADSSNIGKSRRNREKKASSCHSTPTKTRLERGLDNGAA